MPSHAQDLVDAARRSSRMGDLQDALFSIVDANLGATTWGEDLLTRAAVHLQDVHRHGNADLGVLRLLSALHGTEDITDSPYALHLVNELLATGGVEGFLEAQALLTEVDIDRSRRWVDQWARARIVASIRQGDKRAAFSTLLTWIGEDPSDWNIAGFSEWVDMAQAWNRLGVLASWVERHQRIDGDGQTRANMLTRRLKDRRDEETTGARLP